MNMPGRVHGCIQAAYPDVEMQQFLEMTAGNFYGQ